MELIRLDRRPLSGQFCLAVDGLAPSIDPAKLERCLRECGGPLENLIIHRAVDRQWATVQFFCEADCDRCRQQCDGMVLEGRRVAMRRLTKGALSSNAGVLSLSAAKAIDLMNHFIGFNKWSSEVLELWKPEAPESAASSCAFAARVRVFVSGDVVVEGIGDSTASGDSGDECALAAGAYSPSARCKKAAVTNALKAALAQLVVIRFADGRTVVRVVEGTGGIPTTPAPGLVAVDMGAHGKDRIGTSILTSDSPSATILSHPLLVD